MATQITLPLLRNQERQQSPEPHTVFMKGLEESELEEKNCSLVSVGMD